MSEKPKADRASWAPGEILYGDGDVAINAGAERCALAIVNTGVRPVQVASHVHQPQSNAAADSAARRPEPATGSPGVAAGSAVTFDPAVSPSSVAAAQCGGHRDAAGFGDARVTRDMDPGRGR